MGIWRKRSPAGPVHTTQETDDYSLAQRMRTAAVALKTEGRTSLRLSRAALEELHSMTEEAESLKLRCDGGALLDRLTQDGRLMESCAEQAYMDGVKRLPAADGRARIATVMDLLCGTGDLRLSEDRLLLALASFDDVQSLEMAELWAVPEAIRISLSGAWLQTGSAALEIVRERRMAEKWLAGRSVSLQRRLPVFYEHALRLLSDNDADDRRERVDQLLNSAGLSAEEIIHEAHRKSASILMRLDNIVSAKRLIDALDWQKCFETLSAVEAELCCDPTGVYPAMEDDSRAAIRTQTAILARRLGVAELTIARHAVRAAQSAVQSNTLEVRRTVCYWLYDDAGRLELAHRMGVFGKPLPKLTPDPTGKISVLLILALAVSAYGLYLWSVPGLLFFGLGAAPAWCAATELLGRAYSRFIRPAKLLKLKIDRVPDDCRTLVVMPVLLSSPERAEEICSQIVSLGCLEHDDNIQYLILGDFADSDSEHQPGDDSIVDLVRSRIASMNARAGREQYFYLHRERRFRQVDSRWMGRDRKRGALMDLNQLLLDEPGAECAFSIEHSCCPSLKNRFRYVLTLDADTRFLPGTVQRLIGTLAHPLNAVRYENGRRHGYALLQPQMEMSAGACTNAFVRLFAGDGGLNTYPTSVSNYWQDVTGTGIFGGKGIYDVRAFAEALDDALPEGRILSHDLIEGTLAGAALVSDICFYDGFPSTLTGFLRRHNRWTRGDWQLLPVLLGAKHYPPDGRRLSTAERLRLLDNLLRSLRAPSLLALLTQSIWLNHSGGLAAGLLFAFWTPLLNLFRRPNWRRAIAELAILPAVAASAADAIVRTLWRLIVSGKHLLDWVTSADADSSADHRSLPGRLSAILLLPGLLTPAWIPAAVALGTLFAVAPEWIRDLEQTPVNSPVCLSDDEVILLESLGRDIWRFFEDCVTADGHFLPPDNLQVDPDVGLARRTSPTNIGLYLMSCIAAHALGFIQSDAMLRRLGKTVSTLEQMEKWKGHLFNWYDIDSLAPLRPRYVSSVDSGNLAASLLLCASAINEEDAALAERLRAQAHAMDLTALYDASRRLFRIGMDVESGRLSESHYDLLASESRILSFAAMMLGSVPVRHWNHLSRTSVATSSGASLISWSGTMFEYLMPELYMPSPKNTLLGRAVRSAVSAQQSLGEKKKRPWGVSESGYYAFDLHLNYQYRAFGLRELALGGSAPEDVVAPYASLLALPVAPKAAAANLRRMTEAGWKGDYGLYEAADYLHAEKEPQLVKSYMAHHQGMALCALCNALADGALSRAFMRIPEARALALLLEERPMPAVHLGHRSQSCPVSAQPAFHRHEERVARPDQRIVDSHLLGGAGASALVTADGAVHYQRNGVLATRYNGDLLNRSDGACLHIRRERTGECIIPGPERTVLAPGTASMTAAIGPLQCEVQICVSPEDGALLKQVTLANTGTLPEAIRVADCVPVALAPEADMLAHPVFRHLFVESERPSACAVLLRRRPREVEENVPVLLHVVNAPGEISCETDFEKLIGRMGSAMRPDGINWNLSGTTGTVLNPCSALSAAFTIAPGAQVKLHFALGLTQPDDAAPWLERNFAEDRPERAAQLASMQAQAMLGFLGMEPRMHHLLQRLSALLFDRRLIRPDHRGQFAPCPREALWPLGISGDLPLLAVHVQSSDHLGCVREAIRAHEFYHALGLKIDLALVNEYGNDYAQPVRDVLSDVVAFSHLNDLRGCHGGVHLLDGQSLTELQRAALHRAAAVDFDASQDFAVQIRRALTVLDVPKRQIHPMDPDQNRLSPLRVSSSNGYGTFLADNRYAIDVLTDRTTPAPWSNLMTNETFGVLLTERGGGFLWNGNSRSSRLTSFANDVLHEGWGWMLYAVDESTGEFLRLLPGDRPQMPFRVTYSPAETNYRFETERFSGEIALCVRTDAPELRIHSTLRSTDGGNFRLVGFVDWLMGTSSWDAGFVRTWSRDGACCAVGTAKGVGYFAAANARVSVGCDRTSFLGRGSILSPEGLAECADRSGGWVLNVPVKLQPDVPVRTDWTIGFADDAQQAYARIRAFYAQPNYEAVRMDAHLEWNRRSAALIVETPDESVNRMMNGWLLHQTLSSRIRGRTGLYQPGGAYGFRDQLQDMLALLPAEPRRVRSHILHCAAHQFEDGDVMHWWHEPNLGVRTRISDDLLFLPYVTARYVKWTGDHSILSEMIPYLENVEIEQGREDVFGEMRPGTLVESLHRHCMRAFRRATTTGEHGLALMGSGDWNDGMNRVGVHGRGESIWLSEFLSAAAAEYASILPDDADSAWLTALSDRMSAAVEAHGWDGDWYLRAYADDGRALGSASCDSCQIDAISQAWAVLSGLNSERCQQAMDSAWGMLADESNGIIRLLAPSFTADGYDPGYIRGYPEGVRENGAQYTHAACWLLLALIHMGDAERAHRALQMLLPSNHSDTKSKALQYRVEPYVLAADVYSGEHVGRGGWTWYTGSAAWLYQSVLALLGYEQRGSRVRLHALLGDWPEAAVTVRCGAARYRLICRKGATGITLDSQPHPCEWIDLIDDGLFHEAVFPPRMPETKIATERKCRCNLQPQYG